MNRPILIVLGAGILSGVAIGFLSYYLDPFTAGREIKFLFLASVGIVVTSISTLIIYAIEVAWNEGGRYFLAKYFGPEAGYFKVTFRRAILIGVLSIILFILRRYGFFTQYFAGGATAIILIIELMFSAHDRHAELIPKP